MNTNDQFSVLLGINEVMCWTASGIADPVITVVLVVFCFNADIARLATRSKPGHAKTASSPLSSPYITFQSLTFLAFPIVQITLTLISLHNNLFFTAQLSK